MLVKKVKNLFFMACLFSVTVAHASEFGTSIPINKRGLVTYYVTGSINGLGETDFLVDTGSGHSAINQTTLEQLSAQGKAVFLKEVSATLANGSNISLPVYRISNINIGGECVIKDVEAVVLPGKIRNILGLSALEKAAPFAISVNPPRLMLSHCKNYKV